MGRQGGIDPLAIPPRSTLQHEGGQLLNQSEWRGGRFANRSVGRQGKFEEVQSARRVDPELIRAEALWECEVRFGRDEFVRQLFEERPRVGPRNRILGIDDIGERGTRRGDESRPFVGRAIPFEATIADLTQARGPNH